MRNRANYLMGDALATMYDQAYNPIISEREYTDWYKNPNYNPLNDKAIKEFNQYRVNKDQMDELQNQYGLEKVDAGDGTFLYRQIDENGDVHEYGDLQDFYNENGLDNFTLNDYSDVSLSKQGQKVKDIYNSEDTMNAVSSNLSKMTGMPNLQIGTFMQNQINSKGLPHAKWGRNWEYVGRTYGEETPSGFNPNDYTSVYKKGKITAWSTAPIQQSPVPTEEQKPEREHRNPYRPLAGIEGYITSPEQLSDVDWGKRGEQRIQFNNHYDFFPFNGADAFQNFTNRFVKQHNIDYAQHERDKWRDSQINNINNKDYGTFNPIDKEFRFNPDLEDDFETQYNNWLQGRRDYREDIRGINKEYRQEFHSNPKNIYSPVGYWNPPKQETQPMARGGNWREMQEISIDPNTEYVSRSGTERTIDYGAIADLLRSGVRFATGVGYGIEANKSGLTDEQLQAAKIIANNPDAVEVRDPGDIAVNPTGVGTVNPYNQTEIQHFAQYGGRTFEKGGVYHNVTLEELKKLRDGGIKYKII